jgi:hypothetical protein
MIALYLSDGSIQTNPISTKFNVGSIFGESNMATKKRLLLLASVPLTIAVTLGVLAMLPPSPGVTKSNFDRIQEGMTNTQVEAIFGREGQRTEWGRYWKADDGSGAFFQFRDHCVVYAEWYDSHEPILNKFCRWIHLT